MGSLSNLYISQSYQSLIHLGNDTSASATQIELQDGVGQGLGIYVNTAGDVTIDGALIVSGTFDIEGRIVVNDDVRINGNLAVSGATSLTGSLDVTDNITASAAFIENDLSVGGTLFANKVVTLIESSSIIYSSGSNILGDETSDTQTLIGSVIMSGSASLTGSMGITGDISSSTISGIGNVTIFSQSVDSRLDFLEGPFSTSVDSRLDALEDFSSSTYNTFSASVEQQLNSLENFTASTFVNFSQSVDARLDIVEATASLYVPFSQSVDLRLDELEFTASYLDNAFSTSVDSRLDELENWSSSLETNFVTEVQLTQTASFLQNQINEKVFTSSYNAFTSSTNVRLNNLESTSGSVNISLANLNIATASLNSKTGSYAITGSNTFTGSQIVSGSLRGNVITLSVASQTASMDLSLSNFFILTLPSGTTTRLNPTNIQPGQTTQLLIKQESTTGSITYPNNILFPTGSDYSASIFANSQDILSFASFDTSSIYAVSVKNLV